MATTKERLDGHDARLGQLEVALDLKPPDPKKSLLKQKYEWLINHKGTSIILAVVLCAASVSVTYWLNHRREWWNHDVDERIRSVLNEKDGISETLHRVEQTVNRTEAKLETLEPFIHDVIQHQFDSAAKLPTATLQNRLPALQHLLASAKEQRVQTDVQTLGVLAQKLSAVNPKASGYWPAAAEFISYRSQSTAPALQSYLPDCTDNEPLLPRVIDTNKTQFSFSSSIYENCRLTLDSQKDSEKINSLLVSHALFLEFRHCLIVYRGGPVNLITSVTNRPFSMRIGEDPSKPRAVTSGYYSGSTLTFTDCIFDFSFNSAPPTQGQNVTQTLLMQSGPSLKLHIQEPATRS